MPVQSARVISNLSVKNLGRKVGVVLKACEIRAIVELTKFLQVKPENLCLIGIDCPGTFEVADYAKMVQEGKGGEKLTKELLAGASKGENVAPSGVTFRTACQMCEYPVPQADIILKLFGYPVDQEIGIEVGEKFAKEVEDKGILSFSGSDPTTRAEVVNRVIAQGPRNEMLYFRNSRDGERPSDFPRSILHVCPMPQLHGGLPHLLLQGVRFQNSCI
jgi:formate dehydrogenase subunit beta